MLRAGRWSDLEELAQHSSPVEGLHILAVLALARQQPKEALDCIQRSLELEASFSQRNTLAVCLLACGRSQEAADLLHQLLEEQPENADLWFNLARVEVGTQALRQALRCRPDWPVAELLLAERLLEAGECEEALLWVRRNLEVPGAGLTEARIVFRLGRYRDCARLCLGLLQRHPEDQAARQWLFQAVLAAGEFDRDSRLADELEKGLDLPGALLLVPSVWRVWPERIGLLCALLQRDVVADWPLEQWLTSWRRQFRGQPEPCELAEALAVHNFTNEFCFLETAEELQGLEPDHPAYPLYRPLPPGAPASPLVLERHLLEPARERELAKQFEASDQEDPVARQYEESPYPRWRELLNEPPVAGRPDRVLVAGCGTGRHALLCARRYPQAEVWALDLSVASLTYAQRQAERLDLQRVRFLRADLMELERVMQLPLCFDLIESIGVLHHLAEPLQGLRALVSRLAPKGRMRLGFYSRRARRGLEPARRLASALRHLPLRELRARLASELDSEDFAFLAHFKDFYSLSGLRDLLLHERECEYDLSELGRMLEEAGLCFGGFDGLPLSTVDAFVERFGREKLLDLGCWERFEEESPATFRGMYVFWCQASAG